MGGKRLSAAPRLREALQRYRPALLFAVLGMVLLLWPSGGEGTQQSDDPAEEESFDLSQVQREMEQILSEIDGVGRLRLMLTVSSGTQRELAEDSSIRRSAASEYEQKRETLTLSQGSGTQQVVVTRSVYPDYVGALVVCEGGDSASVRLAVTQAVSTLTGLSSERIAVVRGEPSS